MKSPAKKIQPLSIVPAHQAPVKPMLTQEQKEFLDLLADSIVKELAPQPIVPILNVDNEKSNRVYSHKH
jgi:hypothetical protein